MPPTHLGAFIGLSVTLGTEASVVHHPVQQLIRQVSVEKAEVCAGESITIDVLAKDPAAPGAPVAVSIDGVPVSTYTEVESWFARTRFSSLGRAVPGLSLVTSAHSSDLDFYRTLGFERPEPRLACGRVRL